MPLARWSTASTEISERVAFRLRAGAPTTSRLLLWERGGRSVLLHLSTLRIVVKDGWLLANLYLQTEATGRRQLQFVFFLGSEGDGDGTKAGTTIHTDSREGAELAQLWGDDLQRVIWDGVLDVIEGSLQHAARRHSGEPLTILGFTCSPKGLHVDIQAGDV